MFYLGTRVTRKQMGYLSGCAREIRSADRILRRPLIADVATGEDIASREIDLVGIGLPAIGRTLSFGEARNRILQRQRTSSQLTLPWTWLHTESSGAMRGWRSRLGYSQQYIEPEQITMQMIAAVSGGCRGVGFWKTQPLVAGDNSKSEAALSIELACLYLDILEPYLVNGRIERHLTVTTDVNQGLPATERPGSSVIWINRCFSKCQSETDSLVPRCCRNPLWRAIDYCCSGMGQ